MGNKSSMEIEAFLFDVDGTLADTERDGHRPAFNKAFDEFGLGWHWDTALYGELLAVTGGKERIKYYVESFLPADQKPADIEQLAADLHRVKTKHYTELVSQGALPLRPGVKRLLNEARAAGLRLAIATTTNPENVTALLRHSLGEGTENWFEVIAAGDIVPAKKPAPDIYQWALREMNLAPQQCIAFEDSRNGLKSSMAAGIRTLVTINDYTADDQFDGAIAVLSDLGEPDAPFKVLSGEVYGKEFVDIGLIRRWFGA
jgi:HAD superfamily hydrolase (TIGR01509 family)